MTAMSVIIFTYLIKNLESSSLSSAYDSNRKHIQYTVISIALEKEAVPELPIAPPKTHSTKNIIQEKHSLEIIILLLEESVFAKTMPTVNIGMEALR